MALIVSLRGLFGLSMHDSWSWLQRSVLDLYIIISGARKEGLKLLNEHNKCNNIHYPFINTVQFVGKRAMKGWTLSCIVITNLETISASSCRSHAYCLTKYLALLTQKTELNEFAHAHAMPPSLNLVVVGGSRTEYPPFAFNVPNRGWRSDTGLEPSTFRVRH
jgi:hypothetical protein